LQEFELQEDFELFRLIKTGDQQAFSAIYEKYRKTVHASAFMVLYNTTEAEDIVQEVFTTLWEQRSKIQINTAVKFYLSRIAHNMSLNKIQHNSNHAKRNLNYTRMNVNFEDPSSDLNNNDRQDTLKKAMKALPEKSRRSLEIVYLQERSHKEAAMLIGVSVNTIKTQLYTSLKMMRARFNLK
jgi:RNA polymerase sigma-70 factor, ECF subfamily